ncbi:Acg family FMN-binding oxidoreductase [Vibrio sonorensis]|uniref:Acg family FMN-binding oxidoreductase n=1 Tax=Vibrio sonorensis TaxID=1004316 RepID=UPI0008D96D3B|nr:nitroreductase family protein [Vibrio sonorensis]
MNRRNFIKILGTSAVVVAATPMLAGKFGDSEPLKLRDGHESNDIRKRLLSYALLCPNAHNTQPWKVALLGGNTIRLFVDEQRLLPQTDPVHRQIHVSQGTFIESLVIAASQFGIRADVTYFPEGEYDNQSLENLPVADVVLTPDPSISPDPLFSQLAIRRSIKTQYQNETLPKNDLSILADLVKDTDFELRFIDQESQKQQMADYLVRAMEIEESNNKRSLETISMFRFSEEEFAKYRDGFGLEQNGVSGVKKWLAESFFLSRESAEKDPASFGKEGIKTTKNAVKGTQHYAWLSTKDNTRETQVKLGRLYNRFNLMTTALGIAQHPMSQILQEYQDMLPLQSEFKQYFGVESSHTVQMLFRLGRAKPTPLTPRREVSDLIG